MLTLAMHFDEHNERSDSDTIRMLSTLRHTRIGHICGVSEMDRDRLGNLSVNFKTRITELLKRFSEHEEPHIKPVTKLHTHKHLHTQHVS
jgi:hypothetical protein